MMHNQAKPEPYGSVPNAKHQIRIRNGNAKKKFDVANGMVAMRAETITNQNVNSPPMMK